MSADDDSRPAAPEALPVAALAPAPHLRRDALQFGVDPEHSDPEAVPVERVFTINVPLTLGGKALTGDLAGKQIPSAAAEDYGRAGALGLQLQSRCEYCAHFDVAKGAPHVEQMLVDMRAGITHDQEGNPRNSLQRQDAFRVFQHREAQMRGAGLCTAISEIMKSPYIMPPHSGCPQPRDLVGPRGERLDQLFKIREKKIHAKDAGTSAYDTILNAAAASVGK